MQLNILSIFIYAALIILSVYNLRLAWQLSKLQTTMMLRQPEEVQREENLRLKELDHDKRRWNILGRVFFWTSLLVALIGNMEELAFFLDLYSICNIIVLRGNIETVNILATK